MATTDRAAINDLVAIGYESAPGVATPATRILGGMTIEFDPAIEARANKPKGYKANTTAVTTKDSTTGKVGGQPTYDEMPYALMGICNYAAPTTPSGATLARQWKGSMQSTAPDTPATFSLEGGTNTQRGRYAAFGVLTELGFTWDRQSGTGLSGALIAQQYLDDQVRFLATSGGATGGTVTLTVNATTISAIPYNATSAQLQTLLDASAIGAGNTLVTGGPLGTKPLRIQFQGTLAAPNQPTVSVTSSLTGGTSPAATVTRLSPAATQLPLTTIAPGQIDVYAATSYAGLAGASRLTRAFKGSWKLGGRFGPIWTLNSSLGSWADYVELDPKSEMGVTVGADPVGMGFLANVRKNDTVFWRFQATGPLIETTGGGTPIFYQCTLDMAVKMLKVSPLKSESGVLAVDFGGELAHDPTWGKSMEWTVVNTLSAL